MSGETQPQTETLYGGTRFTLIPTTEAGAPERHYTIGILDEVAGEEVGWYGDCGTVYSEGRA